MVPTIIFTPPTHRDLIRSYSALALLVVGHQLPSIPDVPGPANHFCLYIQIPNSRTVRIDVVATGEENHRAILQCSEMDFLLPPDSVWHTEVTIRQGLTVGDVMGMMAEEGLDRYCFNKRNAGCRFWTSTTVDRMMKKGVLVNEKEVDEAQKGVREIYDNEGIEIGPFHPELWGGHFY